MDVAPREVFDDDNFEHFALAGGLEQRELQDGSFEWRAPQQKPQEVIRQFKPAVRVAVERIEIEDEKPYLNDPWSDYYDAQHPPQGNNGVRHIMRSSRRVDPPETFLGEADLKPDGTFTHTFRWGEQSMSLTGAPVTGFDTTETFAHLSFTADGRQQDCVLVLDEDEAPVLVDEFVDENERYMEAVYPVALINGEPPREPLLALARYLPRLHDEHETIQVFGLVGEPVDPAYVSYRLSQQEQPHESTEVEPAPPVVDLAVAIDIIDNGPGFTQPYRQA